MTTRRPIAERFWEKVDKRAACWLWTGFVNPDGYGRFGMAGGFCANAHRVAWELTNGPIPKGMNVCHSCDVRACVNPAHLWLGTQKQNVSDMYSKSRQPRQGRTNFHDHSGANNPHSKLTPADVAWIRCNFRAGRDSDTNGPKLAEKFGVNPNQIRSIAAGKSWREDGRGCN